MEILIKCACGMPKCKTYITLNGPSLRYYGDEIIILPLWVEKAIRKAWGAKPSNNQVKPTGGKGAGKDSLSTPEGDHAQGDAR